jgi:hypothetical protein
MIRRLLVLACVAAAAGLLGLALRLGEGRELLTYREKGGE